MNGRVVDEKGTSIQFASIRLLPWDYTTKSDQNGNFSFRIPAQTIKDTHINSYTIQISFVGKKTFSKNYLLADINKPVLLTLQDNSLTLEQIEVNPSLGQSKNSISSIVLTEEAIERVQAFSIMDILNTLPGKQTTAPNINAPQTLTLRTALDGAHGMNNSLGIPIIVDGIYRSNDANMQARPTGQRGYGQCCSTSCNFRKHR